MTTIEYTLTPDQLSNAVENTIRVFDQYRLRRKTDKQERRLIIDRGWNGMFNYFITETPGGSQLTLEALTTKAASGDELAGYERSFLKNVYKIIDKEIAITPEIARRDIYKSRKLSIGPKSIIWIVAFIILILKLIQAYFKK